MTAAAQGFPGGYRAGYGAYGMGGAQGMGGAYGGAYGVRYGAQYPYPYNPYNSYCSNNYRYQGGYGYGGGYQSYYGRYANYFYPWQSPYYNAGAVAPYSSYAYGYPSSIYHAATVTSAPAVQYAYIKSAATPTKLPDVYHTTQYSTRLTTLTAEDIALENRRVATAHGAYKPRKIKPADAEPNDLFWCRERSGEWHLRRYYDIEQNCEPGRWQMDAEIGFLVFHRD
jgi:hypothetical protein